MPLLVIAIDTGIPVYKMKHLGTYKPAADWPSHSCTYSTRLKLDWHRKKLL